MLDSYFKFPKNIYLLSVSQIIGMSATTLVLLIGGLIGADLAPYQALATLPITLTFVGLALATIPATILMKKIGRKKSFIFSAIISFFATLLATYALSQNLFWLFCLSTLILGTHGAFLQQYRFAALEGVDKAMASKAVGLLLLSGILAGLIGPQIATYTKNIASLPQYSGSFLSIAGLFLLVAILMLFLKETKVEQSHDAGGKERSLKQIITQPLFLTAVTAASVGYGLMVFIMTATPIQLNKISHFSLDHTVFVIQSHIIAMFLPSLITGVLIEKFGAFKILLAGLTAFSMSIFLSFIGQTLPFYWLSLVLLGIGWNFLFISSTVLLPQTYHPSERFRVQGLNDFIVVLIQMLSSFFAGSMLFSIGWLNLNLLTIPLIAITFILFWLYRKEILRST